MKRRKTSTKPHQSQVDGLSTQALTHPSEGHRLFAEMPGSLRELGDRFGCSHQLVANIRHGRAPGADLRAVIERECGIAAKTWEQPPRQLKLEGEDSLQVDTEKRASRKRVSPNNAKGQIVEQIARLRALLDEELSTSAKIQVEKALGTALTNLSRLDGMQISEATVVRHPAHRRVMTVILGAIKPYPEVLKAVCEALQAFEAAEGA